MMEMPSTVGPYRVVRLLGEGGMGMVYEARQETLDRRVALKILHAEYVGKPDAVARFFTEAKVLSRLEHHSIVQIHDFGTTPEGTPFLVMEYLRGETLAQRFAAAELRGERLASLAVLQLGWQIADVLAVAHAEGIAHRDLKPENLMLIADSVAPSGERVKVLDFGLAKLTGEHTTSTHKTDVKAVMGTPLYMSPEQCAGAGGVTEKTDVYSLGCVLYEALAGHPPFTAEGGGQVIGMHLFKEPPPLAEKAPRLAPAVAALIHRLLTKDKDTRPDMSEVADELGRLLAKLHGAAPAGRSQPNHTGPNVPMVRPLRANATTLGTATGHASAPVRRLGLRWAVAAALLLIVVGATGMLRSHFVARRPVVPRVTNGVQSAVAAAGPKTVVPAIGVPASPQPVVSGSPPIVLTPNAGAEPSTPPPSTLAPNVGKEASTPPPSTLAPNVREEAGTPPSMLAPTAGEGISQLPARRVFVGKRKPPLSKRKGIVFED